MTEKQRQDIDQMSRYEMARLWRFAPWGHPLFRNDTGRYFAKVFAEKGGMSPQISRDLGWERP